MQNAQSFNPAKVANPAWFRTGQNDSLYIEAYELALVPDAVPRKIFRFDEIIVLIKSAKLDYLELAGVKIKFGKERKVTMSEQKGVRHLF